MADWTLEQEDYFGDDWDGWEDDSLNPGKTCRYCNEDYLHWQQIEKKWRLFSDKGLHICQK